MADTLHDLLENDLDALDYFDSLPAFVQDQLMARAEEIQTIEEMSGYANQSMHDALLLDQYKPLFEDETDSELDLL